MNYGSGMGVDWDWDALEALIQERGDDVIHELGVACPRCRREDSTASLNEKNPNEMTRIRQVNCQNCHGTGFVYRNAHVIKGLLTQINAGNRQLLDIGLGMPGDSVFSPSLSACELNDMDKITTCVADVLTEGQSIQRGAAHLSTAAASLTSLTESEDQLWYLSNGEAVWCEDENNVVYTCGTDFLLDNNVIRWTGKSPKVGVFYSLKYYYYPEWIVYASPLQRVDRGRSLGIRAVLRKKHVAFKLATDVASPAQRQLEQLSLTGKVKL